MLSLPLYGRFIDGIARLPGAAAETLAISLPLYGCFIDVSARLTGAAVVSCRQDTSSLPHFIVFALMVSKARFVSLCLPSHC